MTQRLLESIENNLTWLRQIEAPAPYIERAKAAIAYIRRGDYDNEGYIPRQSVATSALLWLPPPGTSVI